MSDTEPESRAAAEVLTSLSQSRKRLKTTTDESQVIDLTGPDSPSPRLANQSTIDDDDDDEIQIVDPPSQVTPVKQDRTRRQQGSHHDDDDVQVTGTVNAMQLPHMRPHCTTYPFVANDAESNSQSCDLCYCYVCDVPARDCRSWESHCSATDKGPRASYWNSLRRSVTKKEPTILEVEFRHAKLFRSLFQTMGKFVKDVTLQFDLLGGMRCATIASSGAAFLSLSLYSNFFTRFSCIEGVYMHILVSDLTRAFKNAKSNDQRVVLKATKSVLTVTVESGGSSVETQIPLMGGLRDRPTYPSVDDLQYSKCNIATVELKGVIDEAHKHRAPTSISVPSRTSSKHNISLWIPRGLEGRSLRIKRLEATAEINCLDQFEQSFRTQLLVHFTRSRPPIAAKLNLYLAPNRPMKVEYILEVDSRMKSGLGRFQLYVWQTGRSMYDPTSQCLPPPWFRSQTLCSR